MLKATDTYGAINVFVINGDRYIRRLVNFRSIVLVLKFRISEVKNFFNYDQSTHPTHTREFEHTRDSTIVSLTPFRRHLSHKSRIL